ncbi:MAG TPA: sigma-70 family RNA polymerase sigma factor [Acidimicrobiales bacterium]|nr:sigma-70 family RNA polymerase sigma factor [Acidimicrobiales bacterium]
MVAGRYLITMVTGMQAGDDFAAMLQAAQLGQEWAFAALYRGLNARVLRYFASRVPDIAEDLAAETWMGAARTLGTFQGDESGFRAWLFTIAHRRLVQHWRESARRPPAEPSNDLDAGHTEAGEVEDSALEAVIAQQAATTIAETLTSDQAEVVLLRVLAVIDVEEVARILGKRPGTVRGLQHKAVRKLAATNFFLEALTQ